MKSLQYLIPNHIAEAIGGTLMHSLWQLAGLGLLLIVALALIPQRAARLRYWLAVSTMGLMLAFPIATFGYLYEPPVEPTPPSGLSMASFAAAYAYSQTMPTMVRPPVQATLPEQVNAFFQENAYLFLGIWLLGMVALSVRFAGSCWQVHRLRRVGVQEVPQELAARFVELLDQVGIRRVVSLRYSSLVNTPMVIGALKPVVLLPMGLLSGLSMEQVECILIHELGHIRRWDYLLNVVQSIAEIILFYHPATWWVSKVMRTERENCCDELVVDLKRNKVQYARALLNLEIMRQQPPALAMASQGGDLQSRIRRITGGALPPRKFHARGLLFGLLTVACILLLATQSHTVVKAALPYFTGEKPMVDEPNETDPQDSHSTSKNSADKVTSDVAQTATTVSSNWLSGMFANLPFAFADQDSPVTKIVIVDNEESLELTLNAAGKVVSGVRNGAAIPQDELANYQDRASSTFRRYDPADPMAPMPPMPALGPMSPMPPMPGFAPMPPMPPLPFGDFSEGFDSKEFEKQMEQFGKQMEDWGKQFENQDWQNYSKEMERWGEEFGKQFSQGDWERFGEEMSKFAEQMQGAANSPEAKRIQAEMDQLNARMAKAKTDDEREEIANQIGELADRLGEIQGDVIESRMEDFGQRMEEWGERYAESMEDMANRQEEMAHRQEEMAHRREEMAHRQEEIEIRRSGDMDRAEGERAADASERIGEALVEDGLIKSSRSYKLKLNEEELYVNGKKQPKMIHRRYLRMVSDALGITIGHDWVTFQHNSK